MRRWPSRPAALAADGAARREPLAASDCGSGAGRARHAEGRPRRAGLVTVEPRASTAHPARPSLDHAPSTTVAGPTPAGPAEEPSSPTPRAVAQVRGARSAPLDRGAAVHDHGQRRLVRDAGRSSRSRPRAAARAARAGRDRAARVRRHVLRPPEDVHQVEAPVAATASPGCGYAAHAQDGVRVRVDRHAS